MAKRDEIKDRKGNLAEAVARPVGVRNKVSALEAEAEKIKAGIALGVDPEGPSAAAEAAEEMPGAEAMDKGALVDSAGRPTRPAAPAREAAQELTPEHLEAEARAKLLQARKVREAQAARAAAQEGQLAPAAVLVDAIFAQLTKRGRESQTAAILTLAATIAMVGGSIEAALKKEG